MTYAARPSVFAVFILMTSSNFVIDPPMGQTRITGESRNNLRSTRL